jgi:uncharacterized protein YbjT (DUF2867 family)
VDELRRTGAEIVEVDYADLGSLTQACSGANCVVSALSGLHDVIVDAQTTLLEAAVAANVPRFIPSDFSVDFTKLPAGRNRNQDLRRAFHERLERASIAATSIFNGMFSDLLMSEAPLILFRLRRVLYFGNPDQRLDFTTKDDTAEFTASAALDPSTRRFLRIVGERVTPREMAHIVSQVTGDQFRLLRGGSLATLTLFIKITRLLLPGAGKVYPPWQGMQYMRDMFDGRALLEPLDNGRYAGMHWTPLRDVLSRRA